jgi:cytochrome c peroxidase
VEWETEVFEKFEKPYKREGAGLTLAELYLEEQTVKKDSLIQLITASVAASATYSADSITKNLQNFSTFYLCNRLYLLNLAAIYTTGFECPDTSAVIPELSSMMMSVENIYSTYNQSFSNTALTDHYLSLYKQAIEFVNEQPQQYSSFDHFTFISNYVNPLFSINQQLIRQYKVASGSSVDYSLNKSATSIFSKQLYNGQNGKGIFLRVKDEAALAQLNETGKLLFYDPLLSGNNQRSCISCHKSTEYFTDTSVTTSLKYNRVEFLARNTPSLINANYNHLLMLDGKHISLQNQLTDVITSHDELNCNQEQLLQKILSCPDYKKRFKFLLQYTPQETEISFDHVLSALTFYYTKFSNYNAPFDDAINKQYSINDDVKKGFNLFMSKAQCATCHFVPQFNGVKPPYVGSEFEVLGVPKDTGYAGLSKDMGRYLVNPATETRNAFRTGSIRNADHTKPYMHNGIFNSLQQVIDFYDAGGGAGKGLTVPNQTLSSDSLHLTPLEKKELLLFISSLNEKIQFDDAPLSLPASTDKKLNKRKVGGNY